MAALLQTGTLVDGQWTTTNVDMNTVLERHMERKQEEFQSVAEKPPALGLLTQTVVESPVVHWIISARIRGSEYHDVAFIGDNFVQIRRFGSDGLLHDVARKCDFGSRIRNARVVGTRYLDLGIVPVSQRQNENEDVSMLDGMDLEALPPQYILLALDSGDLVLFYACNIGSNVEFVTYRWRASTALLRDLPGNLLAVDPSSRYIAIAGCESVFSIYALHPREMLNAQCLNEEPFCPVLAVRDIRVRGFIYKIEFLYPAPNDPNHVVLLVLAIKGGTTAMFIYDWDAGQNLTDIRTYNISGHPLPRKYRMPILLIPLVIKSAFLLVFGESIVECHNLLAGTPEYRNVAVRKIQHPSSPLRIDQIPPTWIAWVRPMRTRRYSKEHDDIYIAREDGFVAYIEINSDGYVQSQSEAGIFKGNISTAFASLEMDLNGRDRDFLVAGGEGCDGGVYMVVARQDPELVEPIANWSPAIDFVTTNDLPKDLLRMDPSGLSKRERDLFSKPDRIFACTGRGFHGAISELRHGHEARIRLDVEGLDYPVSDTWVLPLSLTGQDDTSSEFPVPLLFLFAWGNSSLLLHLTADSKVIEEVEQASTWLDLGSRTIAAAKFGGLAVQIAEGSFSVIIQSPLRQPGGVQVTPYKECYAPHRKIVAGAILCSGVVLIMHQDEMNNLYLTGWRIRWEREVNKLNKSPMPSKIPKITKMGPAMPFSDYPSWITMVEQPDGSIFGIVSSTAHGPGLDLTTQCSIFSLDDVRGLREIDPSQGYLPFHQPRFSTSLQEPCVSIANLHERRCGPEQPQLLLAGYRNGVLVMNYYRLTSARTFQEIRSSKYYIGSTMVMFKVDAAVPNTALIYCDSKLWRLKFNGYSYADPLLHRVWFTGVDNALNLQPSVDNVAFLPQGVLIIDGTRLITAKLDPQEKSVPRAMPLYGPPSRVIYSQHFKMLIVGLNLGSKSTLNFIDPENGERLHHHCDQVDRPLEYPYGLGVHGEKVLCLSEWEIKDTAKRLKRLLIVGTSAGSLLIYKMMEDERQKTELARHKVRCVDLCGMHYQGSVTAIVTCATSFFICLAESVHWISLDISSNKFLTHARYQAPSTVLSISVDGYWLNIVTMKHSLMSLLLVDKKHHPVFAEHHGQLVAQLTDEVERSGFDQIPITNEYYSGVGKDATLVVVSDKDCSITGLWYLKKGQSLGRSYGTAFEASLHTSILKFQFGRTRPPWNKTLENDEIRVTSNSAGELLGLGIDGSITHFTLLEEPVWRLLIFLQDLARRSFDESPVTHHLSHIQNMPDPRRRHVNGDILRPYIRQKNLERLLMGENLRSEGRTESSVDDEFCRLVNDLSHDVRALSSQPANTGLESCLDRAYRLLADLFRPVL